MAVWYVDSAATGSNTGTSWANAWTSLSSAPASVVAGDDVYISHQHNAPISTNTTYAFNGTSADPIRLISVNKGTGAVTFGAKIESINANSYTLNNSLVIIGIDFYLGTGTGFSNISVNMGSQAGSNIWIEDCKFTFGTTHTSARFTFGDSVSSSGAYGRVLVRNSQLKLNNASQGLSLRGARAVVENLSFDPSGVLPTYALPGIGHNLDCELFNSDLSNTGTGLTIFNIGVSGSYGAKCVALDCKFPAAWILSTGVNPGARAFAYNCSSADVYHEKRIEQYGGFIYSDSAVYRQNGGKIHETPISWRLVCSTTANAYAIPLVTDLFAVWNTDVGVQKTITVHTICDSATSLTDGEIWVTASSLNSSTATRGTYTTDKGGILTPAIQGASAETWVGTGSFANPQKRALTVQFTPQRVGFIYVRVMLARRNATVYVCPKVDIA